MLTALYAIIAFLAVRGIETAGAQGRVFRRTRKWLAGAVLAGAVLYLAASCRINLLNRFIAPNTYEVKVLSEYLRKRFAEVPRSVAYVLPDWCIRAFTPEGNTEEFGQTSSSISIYPYPMLQLLFREAFPADYAKKGPWHLSVTVIEKGQVENSGSVPVIDGRAC